jgi:hypothetical protein
MLSNKYPVIVGVAPHPSSEQTPKSRPTRSRASTAAAAGARPNPPRKTQAQVVGDDLIRGSSLVFPSKTRVNKQGRAARKAIVWSSDDDIEALTLPKKVDDDAEGPGRLSKRKQQNDTDGMASEHQSKRTRSIPRWTSIDDDTLEGDTFNRASPRRMLSLFSDACTTDQLSISHRKTDLDGRAAVPTSERYRTFDGEGFRNLSWEASLTGLQRAAQPWNLPTPLSVACHLHSQSQSKLFRLFFNDVVKYNGIK